MLYLLYKIGIFLSLTLPIKIAYRIADVSGSVYYFLAKKDKKIVTDNFKVVLNYTENAHKISSISRQVFTNFARYLVEFFRIPKIDLKYIEKHVKLEGRRNLDRALGLGKGVVLLSAHLGNWELGATTLAILGYKTNVVVWTHKNKLINDFFLRQRQSKGVRAIPLGASIRRIFTALKNNEIVGLLGDIDYTKPEIGVKVKLFGRDTVMPKGPAAFSLKTGAPIVPGFLLREEGDKFRFVFEEPIMPEALKDTKSDLNALTAKIAKAIEFHVGRHPGQWFMLTPRWQSPS